MAKLSTDNSASDDSAVPVISRLQNCY